MRPQFEPFELIAGFVRQPLVAGGVMSFFVGERLVMISERASPGAIHNGELVRVLVHKEPLLGIVDAVALQIGESGGLRYIGPKVGPVAIGLIATLAAALCLAQLVWLGLLIGVPIITVATILGVLQLRAVRAFHRLTRTRYTSRQARGDAACDELSCLPTRTPRWSEDSSVQ